MTRSRQVEVQQLCKRYPPPLRLLWKKKARAPLPLALDRVSFSFSQGQICCLLGRNGAGKTTLIKIMAGLLEPDQGEVSLLGYDPVSQGKKARQCVGLVNTNERSFYWRLSLRRNLHFFASLYGLSGREIRSRTEQVLDQVGVAHLAEQRFDRCSSGQKQKLSLARALLGEPRVLLLDEPTSNIDAIAAQKLRRLIRVRLADEQGIAVLWCTHNLQEAEQVCDKAVVIHQGTVVADVSRQEIQKLSAGPVQYSLQAMGEVTEAACQDLPGCRLGRFDAEQQVQEIVLTCQEQEVSGALHQLLQSGVKVVSCQKTHENLETYFTALTQGES